MKYCIYAGAIYNVTSETGCMVYMSGMYGSEVANKDQVKEVPDEVYLQIKDEYEGAVQDLVNVMQRIQRLNDEYYKKRSALQEIRTETGRKEKEIISKALRQIDKT